MKRTFCCLFVVVYLTWAYVQWRWMYDPSAHGQSPAEIIRLHHDERAIDWLSGACQEILATGDPEVVLARFLRLNP